MNYNFFLNLCIFGSRGGIFNPADVEFKRETIIPLFPQVPYSVFCFVFSSLSFPTRIIIPLGSWYAEQEFSFVIILIKLAGHMQVLIKPPYPGQSRSSQKALELHWPFKEKRFKAV